MRRGDKITLRKFEVEHYMSGKKKKKKKKTNTQKTFGVLDLLNTLNLFAARHSS